MRGAILADEVPPPPRRGGYHVGLVFPGSYAESASSLGVHFVLAAVRSRPGCSAGRILSPGAGSRPVTLEDGAGLATLPVLLVSCGWELMVGPLVEILRGSSIPPLASERDAVHPVIVAGGALALSNPDLLTPLADVVVRGDGEQAMHTILEHLTGGSGREDLLDALGRTEGAGEGSLALCPAEELPACSAFVTPRSALPSMHLVEVMRGCAHGCGFCIMSRRRTGRGPRYVPATSVLDSIPGHAKRVGLVGPSVLEHPEIEPILERIADRGLEVGISSARADRVDARTASLLAALGLRTLTVALDGPSSRIRRAIGKSVSARDVVRAARTARLHSIPKLKLYVMLGFEDETDADVQELAQTCGELARSTSLAVSLGPVVPKKNTPLEHMRFVTRRTYESHVRMLRRSLGPAARIDAAPWRAARDEAVLSRMSADDARRLYGRVDPSRPFDLGKALRAEPDP